MKITLIFMIPTIVFSAIPENIRFEAVVARTANITQDMHPRSVDDVSTLGIGTSILLNKTNSMRLMVSKSFSAAPDKFDDQHNDWMNRVTRFTSIELAYKHAFSGGLNQGPFIGCTIAETIDNRIINNGSGNRVSIKKNGGYAAFMTGYSFGKNVAIELQLGIPRYSFAVSYRF